MLQGRDHIDQAIRNVEALTEQFVDLTGWRVDQANEGLERSIRTLEQITELRVSRVESTLMGPITLMYQNAVYHNLKAYWFASPSLILVLTAIWTAIQFIWQVIKIILSIVELIQMLRLDDMLANYWPEFKKARDKFRAWVGELSEAIGWGVDGFLHLLHATQGFTDVLGGLTGKSYAWMDAQWMVKTGDVLEQVSFYSREIKDNPGRILEILFQGELSKNLKLVSPFGEKLTTDVMLALGKGKKALDGLTGVADELTAIQENMPEVVRRNIPSAIWDSLEVFSFTISTEILPRLSKVESLLTMYDTIFKRDSNILTSLADKLAHPGTNLLGIDDLPDYAKNSELWAVDDVASRQFLNGANQDRLDMQPDLDAFELIDAALTAPIPEISFMTIEDPARAALYGIVAEPKETWFIGGYTDQL